MNKELSQLPTGQEVVRTLIAQVQRAANGGSELEVVTRISRPLWRAWNVALGSNPDAEPTEWKGKDTNRAFGSKTIVVDDDGYWSFSCRANSSHVTTYED